MIDGYGADPEKLGDAGLVFETLDALPGLIGMRKIGFPHLARFTEGEIAGVTGFVLIMESHISIHTYSKKGFLTMDVYSCKAFEPSIAVERVRDAFGVEEMDVQMMERGRKFP
jgi:S-adenosylmethionine decarboxylase